MQKFVAKYAPEFVILTVCVALFLFTTLVKPQSSLWVGLSQLSCDLPAHSKCVARGPILRCQTARA